MTGSALVITRLSRVAMNIGSEVASTASQTGTRRLCPGGRVVRDGAGAAVESVIETPEGIE